MPRDGHRPPPSPMLARSGSLPRDGEAWAFEVKWDGVRAIVDARDDGIRVWSRAGNDVTAGYPELAGLRDALGDRRAILDGEIIAFDADGRPSFQALQQRMHVRGPQLAARTADGSAPIPVVLMLFDLLELDGRSLVAATYDERRATLDGLALDGPHWQVLPTHHGDGEALLAATAEQGLEGIIAKRRDAPYRPGRRSADWIKVKHVLRQEFVIGGWLPGRGERRGTLGSLQVGVHDARGRLRHVGGVGTGFDRDTLDRLTASLAPLAREHSPFVGRRPPSGTVPVDPLLVCEVRFAEWTDDGSIRHASFLGLRDDKPALEVVREPGPGAPVNGDLTIPSTGRSVALDVDGRTLKLSNLAKPLYPDGTTKADVLRYYARIAPVLLPHLRDRPVTLKRYPDGSDGPSFFEKHANRHRPAWVQTAPVVHRDRTGTVDYVLIQDRPTLLWAANLAAIELHPSLSQVTGHGPGASVPPGEAPDGAGDGLTAPRSLVFDLDPGPGTTIVECCRVGLMIRELLGDLGLELYAKTSGSKGLQLYVPLNGDAGYARTSPFAHAVAALLEQRAPDLVVSRMKKSLREGKVLIDWSQNSSHKTTVSVYSLRAREHPTVSTPVRWDEVEACAATGRPADLVFLPAAVLTRVRADGDGFAPLLERQQSLPDLAI